MRFWLSRSNNCDSIRQTCTSDDHHEVQHLGADHEVVDINGFIFKRKRRTPLTDSANVPAEHFKRTKSSVAPRV